jgi:DNA-binding SARP family transcriptional activator/TolB-like protein
MTEPAHLNVLGAFRLCVGGNEVPMLPRKVRALLAYLAMQRGQRVIRDAVGELLWSDRGAEQVRHSLRQALGDLRRHVPECHLVISQEGTLKLADRTGCDATLVLQLSPSSDRTAMRAAVDAYSGPLLSDFPSISRDFDGWLSSMRSRLESLVLDALDRLIAQDMEGGNNTDALSAAERMFAIDPLREDIHRRLIEVYAAAGRRSEALRRYGTIVELLRRELDVAPSRETRELAQRIRREMDIPRDDAELSALPVWAEPTTATGAPIAVLPLQQLGGDQLPSHLTDGLATDIICQLAGLRELSVISYGTTFGLRDTNVNLRSVGRMLGVRYVVRGSLRSLGQKVRLTTELTDVESGVMVWGRSLDASRSMSFEDQDRMVALLVNALAPRVHEIELRRIRGKRPESLATYEKVLPLASYC